MKHYEPFEYQAYCIDKIINTKKIGLFLDMGLGKTAITLSAVKRLRYDYWQAGKVLVVAPKKVAEATWTREAAEWFELSSLTFSSVLGSQAQRLRALDTSADIYLINRENVCWLVDHYRNDWPFDMVVLDESSSFKNHRAKRFKALKTVLNHIERIVLLTGTPTSNGLTDLWSQIYLLDHGERLGRTVTSYRDAFFLPDKRNATTIFSYKPREGAEEQIYKLIGDICVSMKAEDYLDLPPLIFDTIPVKLDPAAQKKYDRLERDALLEVDEDIITAGSAGVLRGKLLQLCNGAVYDEDGAAVVVHDCKIEALMETVEQLNSQHAIICYRFKHDLDRLWRALESTDLRVAVYKGVEEENAWNAGEVDILLVQPASCGYGLNLQKGGYHLVWFGLTDSLELYQQTNCRLYRQGQTRPVIVHQLVVQGGVDEDVVAAIDGKAGSQERLLEAIKVRIKRAKERAA